jgi:hypothetical protein
VRDRRRRLHRTWKLGLEKTLVENERSIRRLESVNLLGERGPPI